MLKLSTPLLARISREISNGRVLWAILTTNEYIFNHDSNHEPQKDPLYNAIIRKAEHKLSETNCDAQTLRLFKILTHGKRLSSLSSSTKECLKKSLQQEKTARPVFRPRVKPTLPIARIRTRGRDASRESQSGNPKDFRNSKILS